MARLKIEFRGAETTVPLKGGETTVGRSNRCTIHLPDPQLGPIHFRIRRKGEGYQLKDDGSGIGTRVNGKPVYATTLRHGDYIRAGSLRCHFLGDEEAAPRQPEPPVERAPARPVDSRVFLWAGVGAVVVLAAVFFLLRGSSQKEARALWQQATRALDDSRVRLDEAETHLARAVDLLERIGRDHGDSRVAGTARTALVDARGTLEALARLQKEARAIKGELDEEAAQDAFTRLARLKRAAHPAVVARTERLEEELKHARVARYERRFAEAQREVDRLMADKRFAAAVRVWRELEIPDYLYRKRADRARSAAEKQVAREYRAVLRLAGRSSELEGRIGLLEASRETFEGTPQAEDLEVRISALRARRTQLTVIVRDEPKPTEPTGKPGVRKPEAKPPVAPAPYEEPARVRALVKERRFGEAAATLNALSRHPEARVRLEELTLLANLMADLVGAIQTRPAEFTSVLLPRGRGDAVGADTERLTVRRDGSETPYAWDAVPAKSFPKLFRQAGFGKPPRLAVALFLDEEGLEEQAEQAYVAFFKSEQAPTTLTRVLARRRGIEEPAGGFLLFRGRLVTEAEQARVLLLERIDKLGRQARSTIDKRRREAWAELERIGAPAHETFRLVLKERRQQVADGLKKSKAFTARRFAAKFGKELRARRKAALDFILDANKYPYPNKSEAAQKEAERLVDEVRAIYARPYGLLLQRSEEAQALDRELLELDGRLARLDPLSEPLHDTVVEAVTGKLETRLIAIDERDRKRIDYNLAVAKYNREVETTADAEERANVKAVNEYRWMMGQHAVKIDERLVRAARKHSIEMQQRDYFAHPSPTKHLRTPGLRAQREGYKGGVSENIARGAGTGVQAFWQWFKSSGHHRNMVNPGHTDLGCGTSNHHWWTQKFGRLTGRSLDPPKVPPDPDPPGESGNGDPPPGQGEE
ncbi:MAG: CAP domain-containing protein [Planctomycetota bacterium]